MSGSELVVKSLQRYVADGNSLNAAFDWLWSPATDLVWPGYLGDISPSTGIMLQQWRDYLDPICLEALNETLYRLTTQNLQQVCNLCHQNGTWYKFVFQPYSLDAQTLVKAQVLPLYEQCLRPTPYLKDAESGLMSAEFFRESLIRALHLGRRHQEPFILLSVLFNERLEGVEQPVAAIIADVMKQRLRGSDCVGRYQQNELQALLYGAKPQVAHLVAAKLQQAIGTSLSQYDNLPVQIGWVQFPQQGDTLEGLLAQRFEHRLVL